MGNIDNLDRKILEIISENARIPFKDIAEVCGVSRAAIHQRVQRMIASGVILGSNYRIKPELLGYSTCAYIGLTIKHAPEYRDIIKCLEKIPEVVECHLTTGPYAMLLKVYARDNAHLKIILNEQLQTIPNVVSTETLISLEETLNKHVPIC